jgi:exopolyphosphatase/guanosine-5'-triphosphate,3'-diphosphate pyrophosphatase
MNILNFGSVDIGSNGVRLLISMVIESKKGPIFRKLSLTRVPIRLGSDVFATGKISDSKVIDLINAMSAYKKLMEIYKVKDYRAFATSAMRTAENGPEVIEKIKNETGIQIEIVTGEMEASTIAPEIIPSHLPSLERVIYVDVGGGSTEMTYIHNESVVDSISLQIGTVRMLDNLVDENEWNLFRNWYDKHNLTDSGVSIIGTGGNINKLLKILRLTNKDYYISVEDLKSFTEELKQLTYAERIVNLVLNPDRADVLLPACNIFLNASEILGNSRIYIPKIGLSDGIVKHIYDAYKNTIE